MCKFIKFKLSITLILLTLLSCSKDLGNYEYVAINEVEFVEFQEEYTAKLGESFALEPNIKFTKDTPAAENRYEYEWFVLRSGTLPADARIDLATTKNLILEPVLLPPGKFTLVYEVKDRETGVAWQKKVILNVVSTIYEGWMVLNEVNGASRLDMISLIDGTYTPIHDVLGFVDSSLKLQGAPVAVETYSYDYSFYGIYVTTTGNGTTKIHPETFDWKETYRLSYEAIANFPNDFGADFIQPVRALKSYMYKGGDVYYYFGVFQTRYGTPINLIDGISFEAAPFIGVNPVANDQILYNNTTKKFVKHNASGATCSNLPEGTLFNYQTGKDLIYMSGTRYNGGEVFALLKDPNDSRLFMARMTLTNQSIEQVYYKEVPDAIALAMNQADHLAINPDFGYLFYSLNGQVYEYDFSLQTSKLMIDKSGQEITLLAFDENAPYDYLDTSVEDYRKKLVVASYDPAASKGTFELYNVPPVNGDLQLSETFDGFGKIVSESYRSR